MSRPLTLLSLALTLTASLAAPGMPASAARSATTDHARHAPTARTATGWLKGTRQGTADAFLGVPYAAPPVGQLRFTAPHPAAAWHGVREAGKQGPACPQFQPGGVRDTQRTSEDCLYLDLYRPAATPPSAKLPVVLWVHGGGYAQGTGVIYGGQTLATMTGSVVISINYRLGALGYLALDGLDAASPATKSGNWGLLDQMAALKWVERNVAAFGGNPGNVTVAGQSAGGSAVCTLLASPQAAGLFDRAVVQSAFCGLGERPLPQAGSQGLAFAAQAGCPDSATRLTCLRAASATTLVAAFQTAGGSGPTIGTPVLPNGSAEAIRSGRWNRVPVVIGATAHEGKLFLSNTPDLSAGDYRQWLTSSFGDRAGQVLVRYPLWAYPAPFYAQAEALGDDLIYCGAERTADLLASRTMVFRYEFDDPDSPTLYGFQPPGVDMSSTHSAELAYLFDFTLGAAPVPPTSSRLAAQIKRYWGEFAEDGDPNTRGLPSWPAYRTGTHRTLVLRPDGPRVSASAGREHNCAFWADLRGA
jgi:para-nitrobenzyl esterase